jgi:hypothetical protein
MKQSNLPPELYKTVYFTPRAVFDGSFATVTGFATVTATLSFLFIFAEYLKIIVNHRKFIK